MAIDLFTARAGLDRNKYYKGTYVNNMKLIQDAVVQGVFYSTDEEPKKRSSIVNGSTKHIETRLKIKTTDYIDGLDVDDFVLYGGDDELYIVEDIVSADFEDEAKPFSRHSNTYIVSLRR